MKSLIGASTARLLAPTHRGLADASVARLNPSPEIGSGDSLSADSLRTFGIVGKEEMLRPRALAAWGVFSALVVAICTLTFIIFPHFEDIADAGCYLPIATSELTMGFWLLLKGLRPSGIAQPDKARDRAQASAA